MKCALMLPLLASFALHAQDIDWANQVGRDLGKWTRKEAFDHSKSIDPNDWVPLDMRGQTFDPEIARSQALAEEHPQCAVLEYLESEAVEANEARARSDDHDFLFIRAEEATSKASCAEDAETTSTAQQVTEYTERCLEADGPCEIQLTRTLEVEVKVTPPILREVRQCKGHYGPEESHWKQENALKAKQRLTDELAEDSTLQDFEIEMTGGGALNHYHVQPHWWHYDDHEACDDYALEVQTIQEEIHQEVDRWIVSDDSLWARASSPELTLASRRCLDDRAIRIVDGKEVTRPCWREEFTFLGRSHEGSGRSPLWTNPRCRHSGKRCLQEGPLGCALWEHTFLCQHDHLSASALADGDALDSFSLDEDVEEGTGLPQAVATLSVFSEMKGEIEASEATDPATLQLFKGARFTCSKSIATDLMYDCCFSYKGLAKTLHLAKCNADELALADRRERQLCHYIGKYEEDFLGLWKSRDVHVFCCFSSKLARSLQEGARDQLGISWGTPENPNCRGLYTDEIAGLDLSQVDLKSAYEVPASASTEGLRGKMDELAARVKQRVLDLQGEVSHGDS
ncbi:MAG: conjugal transfer protein TraN [Candidatus Obscuribacterales bacterium]